MSHGLKVQILVETRGAHGSQTFKKVSGTSNPISRTPGGPLSVILEEKFQML